jgi:hypothetical protein
MTTHTFNEIKWTGKKRVSCGNCGTKVSRRRTFMQTVNPFNKHDDGTPKSPREVSEAVQAELQEWKEKQTGELCSPCYKAKWFPQESA